jgi:signal transduction histidine kinase
MRFINDFRRLSGVGGATMERERFSIVQLAREAHDAIRTNFPDSELSARFPEQELEIFGFRSLTEILLRNLYENAFSHGRTQVRFSWEDKADGQVFVLENETEKRPLEEDIFLPFVTGGLTGRTGLGLAIVRKVVDYHKGRIWSEYESGRFRVLFSLEAS